MQKQDVQKVNSGLSLFGDIEDAQLRNRNRATIMANVFEDNLDRKSNVVSPRGAAMILGYFSKIPDPEKKPVYQFYKQTMAQRGFQELTNAG